MTNMPNRIQPPHADQIRRGGHRHAGAAQRQFGERAGQGHQDRPRQPEDRPARRLRRGRPLHPRSGARHSRQGPAKRRQDLQGRDRLQGQPVERQPRRGGRLRADPARQGRSARHRPARPTPPIRCPTRPRSTRCPASPPTARGSRISSAARAIRPRASTGPICSSGAWRTSSRRSPRCGTARRPTRWSAACSPTTPTATPGATRSAACRRRSPQAGYKLIDPGRYQQMNNDFSSQIAAFKSAGAEIVTGVMIPPDFATFWSQAAQQGFKPKIVTIGKALLFPSVDQRARRPRQRPHLGNLVVAEPSVQVGPHRPELRSSSPTPMTTRPSGRGRSRSASSTRCSRWRSTSSSAPRRSSRRRSSMRWSRPTTSRSSARCSGPASR